MPFERIIKPADFSLPRINENVILFFNLNHFFMFRDYCSPTKVKSYGPSKKYNFQHQEKSYTAIGGCIGAPLAVITLENAIESGGKHFLTFGSAGWLSIDKPPSGIINSISAINDQTGISEDYGFDSNILNFENNAGYQIVSTNSFYQLTKNKVIKYREQNIALIDMEIAPLLFISKYFKVALNPQFIISDYVDSNYQWNNLANSKHFIEQTMSAMETLRNQI
jgi:uridine phosphorylase